MKYGIKFKNTKGDSETLALLDDCVEQQLGRYRDQLQEARVTLTRMVSPGQDDLFHCRVIIKLSKLRKVSVVERSRNKQRALESAFSYARIAVHKKLARAQKGSTQQPTALGDPLSA